MTVTEFTGQPGTAEKLSAAQSFRAAMARFASGVTVVTTQDERHRPYGFTASSFCSVSLEPPLILVCLAREAYSYRAFASSARFAVSILQAHHTDLARTFATPGADKFEGCALSRTPSGLPVVNGALAVI